MTLFDYYNILGISSNATVEEIKKAYRSKARQYHPDINHASDAKDHFISITEAYEFLIAYQAKINSDEQAYNEAIDDWRKYRQTKARRRANAYARTSYDSFKNTSFYKTTRIFDGTIIIYGFIISVTVIICTITGYFYRLKHPIPGLEKPSVFTFIMLLLIGVGFFVVTYIYLISYLADSNKREKKSPDTA